jgi:hypothetical protein
VVVVEKVEKVEQRGERETLCSRSIGLAYFANTSCIPRVVVCRRGGKDLQC